MNSHHQCCLLCQSRNLKPLSGYERAYLVRCGTCRFVFSSAIPAARELTEHYEQYSRDDYLSPITVKRFHELLDQFEPYRKNNRMLDVGCGIGLFLEVAKERGWNVYGTEFTERAVEICTQKGIIMHKGPLNPNNYQTDFFDIATSFEVIEHINNPIEDITNIAAILRSQGLLYITTPNFNSLSRVLLKSKWNIIGYPEHLSYYTPKTITALLRRCGFDQVRVQTTGISTTSLKTNLKRPDQKFISATSDDEKVRVILEKNHLLQTVRHLLNHVLTVSGSGDTIKVMAQKA